MLIVVGDTGAAEAIGLSALASRGRQRGGSHQDEPGGELKTLSWSEPGGHEPSHDVGPQLDPIDSVDLPSVDLHLRYGNDVVLAYA